MPIIFQVKCGRCKYIENFPDFLVIAVDNYGKEYDCAHPFESLIIEKVIKDTGKSYDVLRQMGQIYNGQPLLCNSCGKISYYSDAIINSLNLNPHNSHVTGISCKKCSCNNLYLPFPSSLEPKSLFPYYDLQASHSDRHIKIQLILFLVKIAAWILGVILIVSLLNLALIYSIILSIFIIVIFPVFYIYIKDMIDTQPERNYWATIPCPRCKKNRLSFKVAGIS